jgi:hypothetical protein
MLWMLGTFHIWGMFCKDILKMHVPIQIYKCHFLWNYFVLEHWNCKKQFLNIDSSSLGKQIEL